MRVPVWALLGKENNKSEKISVVVSLALVTEISHMIWQLFLLAQSRAGITRFTAGWVGGALGGGEVCTKPGCAQASVNIPFTSLCSEFTQMPGSKSLWRFSFKKNLKRRSKKETDGF